MKSRTNVFFLFGIACLWLVSWGVKLKFNGLILGMDFGLYHPDGKLYSFRSLTMSGKSEFSSGLIVSDWYRGHAFKLNSFEPDSLYFVNNPLWQLYRPRVLYPLLSVPFVMLLGMPGMLVVPALSMFVLMVAIQLMGFKLHNKELAFALVLLISMSPVVNRWMFANITDGLLVAISSLFVVSLLYIESDRRFMIVAGVLIALGSLTRTSVLQWVAICLGLYMANKRLTSVTLGLVALGFFIPSALGNLDNGILPNENKASIVDRPLQLLESMGRTAYFEIGQLAVLDRLLLVLLTISLFVSIMHLSQASSKYYLLTLLALWVTGAINGTVGVNFRYQLPILPFMAYSILESCSYRFEMKRSIKQIT